MIDHENISQTLSQEDIAYLELAVKNKNTIFEPRHSNFRTYTIITYLDNQDNLEYVTGTNRESFFIGGTICGERMACMKLAEMEVKELRTIYLVSDSDQYISMGLACRDFLIDQLPENTRVVMWSKNNYRITSLSELYPYPAIYRDVNVRDVLDFAKDFCKNMEKPNFQNELGSLYKKVIEYTKNDNKDVYHPIQLAAGVLYSDGSTDLIWQNKMLEFAKTIDPVSSLVSLIRINRLKNLYPIVIIQSDQFGVLHSLSDSARSNLVEDGFEEVDIYLHDKDGKIVKVKSKELYPDEPKVSEML